MKKALFVKMLRVVLCALLLLPLFTACKKDDTDGPSTPPEDAYAKGKEKTLTCVLDTQNTVREYLIRSGNGLDYQRMGLVADSAIAAEGASVSGKWAEQHLKTSVSLAAPATLKDITAYKTLNIMMYSAKNTGSTMQFCINCQGTPEGKTAYKRHEIKVNWTGWRLLKLNLEDFADGYGANFAKVSNYAINAIGWSQTPNPETVVYIDSIYFSQDVYVYNMTEADIGEYNYDQLINVLASFKNGGTCMDGATGEELERLQGYVNAAKSAQSNMRRGSTVPFDADMTTTAGITANYNHIRAMAIGYSVMGSDIYKSKPLLEDIVYALDYMHANYYREKSLHQYPTRNNWWDWEIGAAQAIVDTLMLLRGELTQAQIDKYLAPVNTYVPLPHNTMANRVDTAYVAIAASALQKDYKRLVRSRDLLDECCLMVESGDGFYTDGSFIQHTCIPYTGSYGTIMLEALSRLILAASDTCFRFGEEMINCQYRWVVESFSPLMYHGAMMGLVRGRSVYRTSTDVGLGLSVVQGMLRMTKYLRDAAKSNYVASVVKEYAQYNDAFYKDNLAPVDLAIYEGICQNGQVAPRTNYRFAKVFGRMDRPIAQLANYAVGISLSSARIAKYEAINNENKSGWYTGDGMLYVYTSVDDYSPSFWKNVNPYRMPGTTVTTAQRVQENIDSQNTLSQYEFVGGAALDNTMVAAMQFESATAKMSFNSSLTGKKAWFVFDNEIVCLGADISCTDSYNVETVIENRRLAKNGKFFANGVAVSGVSGALEGTQSMYIESFGGVYLPDATTVKYNRTSGEEQFLELYIDHGKDLQGATYAYVLLPTMSESDTATYAAAADIEILCNSAAVMAVRDHSSRMTGYIFFEAGEFNGVAADHPCTVLVSDTHVAVADPTQRLTSVNVTVNGNTYSFNSLAKGATQVLAK